MDPPWGSHTSQQSPPADVTTEGTRLLHRAICDVEPLPVFGVALSQRNAEEMVQVSKGSRVDPWAFGLLDTSTGNQRTTKLLPHGFAISCLAKQQRCNCRVDPTDLCAYWAPK